MSEWKLVPVEPAPSQVASGEYEVPDPLSHRAANVARNVYRAMLDAAPVPTAADCTSVCDAYAAENQQFSDELVRLRARLEVRDDGGPDGITCRDETIRLQDEMIERLRAENEATRSALVDAAQKQKEEQSKTLAAVDRLRKESDALIAMHSALRAENERLKADAADAARYRWIKRGASFREERDMGPGGCWSIFVAVPRRPAVNSLDTAIDAAMAQGKV